MGDLERLLCRHLHIGKHSGPLPIGPRHRVDGPARRYPHPEMLGDGVASSWVGRAGCSLADQRRTLEILEVVAKLLRPRDGTCPGEEVHRPGLITSTWNIGQGPVLLRAVALSPVQIVEMGWLCEEIAREEGNHGGMTAAILTQVDDERTGVGEKIHCRDRRLAGKFRREEATDIQIADVASQ